MAAVIEDPGPEPQVATPEEREAWRKANERFLTEGHKKGVSQKPAKIDPTDKRLRDLRREHNRFLELRSPMKASLWLALLRPAKDVIHDVEMTRRFALAQQGINAGEYVAPERPSIVEIGQRLVAAALGGDVTAIDRIADRIEGKAGLREGDEDEGSPERRKQVQDTVEQVITLLTKNRVDAKADNATIVDVEVERVK